jgi:RimJ/RimL family protein N-acetyltransferase
MSELRRALDVREMTMGDTSLRIDYFHDADDAYLTQLGVDRSLLPSREAWNRLYQADYARPIEQREYYSLLWQLDGETVGFSSTDRIEFGAQAWMHLHLTAPTLRGTGLGAQFVALSARRYFEVLAIERLYCEPNAFNVAANRTLQAAGFQYLFSHHATPSPINFPQATTRWVLEADTDVPARRVND